MKCLLVALLFVCLVQTNTAHPDPGLLNMVGSVAGAVGNVAGMAGGAALGGARMVGGAALGGARMAGGAALGGARMAGGAAMGVAKGAINAVGFVLSNLPGIADLPKTVQNMFESAIQGFDADKLLEMASGMQPEELAEAVLGAENSITAQVASVRESVSGTLNRVNGATECARAKVAEAKKLVQDITELPGRATRMVQEGLSKECQQQDVVTRRLCQLTKIIPLAVQSAMLVRDTVAAVQEVADVQGSVEECLLKG